MSVCKNCQHTFEDDFCNRCGQRALTERVTWKYFLQELSQIFFYIEGVLWFTVKELVFRPGTLVSNYLKGQRVKYYKPIGLLFVTSGIYLLVKRILESKPKELNLDVATKTSIDRFFDWMERFSENVALWELTLIPIITLVFYLTFRKKTNYNYWEFAIILLYHSCLMIIIDIVSVFVEKIPFINSLYTSLFYAIVWLYFFIAVFKRYYTTKRLIVRFLILFLWTILAFVICILLPLIVIGSLNGVSSFDFSLKNT